MRTREQIERDMDRSGRSIYPADLLLLEILLDIRELLMSGVTLVAKSQEEVVTDA